MRGRFTLLYSDISYVYVDFICILTDLVIQPSSISCVLHCKYILCLSPSTCYDGFVDRFFVCVPSMCRVW
jgi:hypothetical protein